MIRRSGRNPGRSTSIWCYILRGVYWNMSARRMIVAVRDTARNRMHKKSRWQMTRNIMLFIIAGLLSAAVPMLAHHSEAAQFDTTKPVKVTGTVKKIEWMNPHVWFYVDVKDDKGNI